MSITLKEKMYVRLAADIENMDDPRIFVCGQIMNVDVFENTLTVRINDPFQNLIFFDDLPRGDITISLGAAEHCKLFIDSFVLYKGERCKIIAVGKSKDEYFYYYVQMDRSKEVFRVCETDLAAAFNNGSIDPAQQLINYEFQNPIWYLGHSVVSKSMSILENAMYGFKELAGSKIYLLPHQVNTIMRCLQGEPCRYMLADEVGMGKTIEAISILKIYMQSRCNLRILIVVPDVLKEQWKTELLFKFDIIDGRNADNNSVVIKSISEVDSYDMIMPWDFTIVDEVHRYLENDGDYSILHCISHISTNILLLSATPVQTKKNEYLKLLRILQPDKYDDFTEDKFSQLISKQSKIIQKTALVLDNLDDFKEEIEDAKNDDEDPHEHEECEELYEEIHDGLEDICEELSDPKLNQFLDDISFDAEDLGIYKIKVIISYICSNYQIESNVIRNRRRILEGDGEEERLLPVRKLVSFKYELDADRNFYEAQCYRLITEWLSENKYTADAETTIRPLLGSLFSSPWAFSAQLSKIGKTGVHFSEELIRAASYWKRHENSILKNLTNIMDDPDSYQDEVSARIVTILNIICEELFDKKIVIFTNYDETFDAYKKAFEEVFDEKEMSFFSRKMKASDIEMNAYKFQSKKNCRIMLCDYTGGEGRNFQCADYVLHIDLPWDANTIEQRIGRLDRLERDKSRPVVYSVVVYTEGTFEEALFKFWNEGLKIFTQSLSGMEIIMNDINEEIISAIREDFEYGLFERIEKIIKTAESMREEIRKEQNYDAASFIFRPMYKELKKLIEYYSENENILFESSMRSWASLAGFVGRRDEEGIVRYSETSFSPRAAVKSQFIPPVWKKYLDRKRNKLAIDAEAAYENINNIQDKNRSIKGTFIRKKAIENDYIHFFAPGDDVFDAIVDNALKSTKGQSAAFAVKANIEWKGLIFTWKISPNETYLLDNNVSVHALSPYRNYLMTRQLVVPVSISNPGDCDDSQIVQEYTKCIGRGIYASGQYIVHLGRRENRASYLKDKIIGDSNVAWFKMNYPEEIWHDFVKTARKEAFDKAAKYFKRYSNIGGAKEEMERILSARAANSEYYGLDDTKIDNLKKEQEYILESLVRGKIKLDSAAYIWMVKNTDE